MTIGLKEIHDLVLGYLQRYPEDSLKLQDLVHALRSGRSLMGATTEHITCGALLIDQHLNLLLVHHNVLRRWLLPGGHPEEGDLTLLDVATREVYEEVGVNLLTTALSRNSVPHLVDIDVHTVPPARPEKAHRHFDFRFAFFLNLQPQTSPNRAEVTAIRWTPLRDCLDSRVVARLTSIYASTT